MKTITKIGTAIIAILVIAVIGLLALQIMPAAGFKVTISGQAGYGTVGGWGLEYYGYQVSLDNWYPFGFWPWETGSIVVECTLTGTEGSYHGSQNLGAVNKLNPFTEYKPFNVPLRRIPEGEYLLHIDVYEVQYPLGIPIYEISRVLVKSLDPGNVEVPFGGQ